jgi:hypothetical protein
LPDISKINALAIGSVAKVDGLAKASILDINGVAVVSAVAPPLDTYTNAAAAYSVRLLRTAYTGDIMRVRRASDNVEGDVGFDGGELKLTSPISNTSDAQSYTDFADFVDHTGTATDAFCRYWYDQSGNANDAGQSTAGSQPQIYDATTGLIIENGKPALDFDGSNDEFPLSLSGLNTNNLSAVTVCQSDATSGSRMQFTLNTGSNARYWHYLEVGLDTFWYAGTTRISHGAMNTSQRLRTFIAGSTSTVARSFLNGTEASTTRPLVNATLTANQQVLGNYHTGSFFWDGTMQEFIVWGADQFNNRTGIEDNLNGFFSIYP